MALSLNKRHDWDNCPVIELGMPLFGTKQTSGQSAGKDANETKVERKPSGGRATLSRYKCDDQNGVAYRATFVRGVLSISAVALV